MSARAPARTTPRAAPVFRGIFFLYAAALLIATHWPRLVVEGPVARTDLFLHFGAFALWSALLHASSLTGIPGTRRALHRTLIIALAYAVLDEGSQALPIIQRTFDPLDLIADSLGAATGALGAWAFARRGAA